MSHGIKVIIGFTVMITIGLGVLYYTDQNITNGKTPGAEAVNNSIG